MHTLGNGLHFVGQRNGVAVGTCVSRNTANVPLDDVARKTGRTTTGCKATRYKLYAGSDGVGYFYTRGRCAARQRLAEYLDGVNQLVANFGYLGVDAFFQSQINYFVAIFGRVAQYC